jgi:hypothetical protein
MMKKFFILMFVCFAFSFVIAENMTTNASESDLANLSDPSSPDFNFNASENVSLNETILVTPAIILTGITPKETKIGDVQMLIQIQNKKNETLSNPAIFISGKGYSTYEIAAVDDLVQNEKGYLVVQGNFKEAGIINLSIRINQEIFYQNVSVVNPNLETDKDKLDNIEELANLSKELDSLKQQYNLLTEELATKQKQKFDVASISLADAKSYLRNAETNLITENVVSTKANIKLASEEIDYMSDKLEKATVRPFMERLKDNLVPFSVIAGSVMTFFALWELLKKKSEKVVVKITSIKREKTTTTEGKN